MSERDLKMYIIQISECQRRLIEAALRTTRMEPASVSAAAIREPEELDLLIDMLDGLPATEAQAPGSIHGFCL